MESQSKGEWFVLTGATLMLISVALGFLESVTGIAFFAAGACSFILGFLIRIAASNGKKSAQNAS